jgi:hypothetical protein
VARDRPRAYVARVLRARLTHRPAPRAITRRQARRIRLRFDDVRGAWEAKDSDLADLIVTLVELPDPSPADGPPVREGAPTFAGVASEIRSYAFRQKPREEQATLRALHMKAVEAKDAERLAFRPSSLPDQVRSDRRRRPQVSQGEHIRAGSYMVHR